MNSYQKLKLENAQLKHDITILIQHKTDSIEYRETFFKHVFRHDVEVMVWAGAPGVSKGLQPPSGMFCFVDEATLGDANNYTRGADPISRTIIQKSNDLLDSKPTGIFPWVKAYRDMVTKILTGKKNKHET